MVKTVPDLETARAVPWAPVGVLLVKAVLEASSLAAAGVLLALWKMGAQAARACDSHVDRAALQRRNSWHALKKQALRPRVFSDLCGRRGAERRKGGGASERASTGTGLIQRKENNPMEGTAVC